MAQTNRCWCCGRRLLLLVPLLLATLVVLGAVFAPPLRWVGRYGLPNTAGDLGRTAVIGGARFREVPPGYYGCSGFVGRHERTVAERLPVLPVVPNRTLKSTWVAERRHLWMEVREPIWLAMPNGVRDEDWLHRMRERTGLPLRRASEEEDALARALAGEGITASDWFWSLGGPPFTRPHDPARPALVLPPADAARLAPYLVTGGE